MTSLDNALIGRLDGAERARFLERCQQVPLRRTDRLFEPGEAIEHVYFPIEGFACLFAQEPGTPELIIAMVGREGMLDPRAALGIDRTPVRARVQGEGRAWRLPAASFREHLETRPAFKCLMDRYVAVVLDQSATLALCLRYHEVGARLARWLLMSQDRTGSDHCQVTQEALSDMLGVRRVSITTAANMLQRRGAIDYHRGHVQVLDRAVLEEVACICYHADRRRYDELMK